MTTVILCGGRGTRLSGSADSIPKPLVEIGGKPILWHVLQIYRSYGVSDFVLCLGYRGELIKEFIDREEWGDLSIECVDTGADTNTGGRLLAVRDRITEDSFCVTYADGVADLSIGDLLTFHDAHGQMATVTAVRPALPFGVMEISDDGRVGSFTEKPPSEHWINGGFFCFGSGVFDLLESSSVLEREPLERLAADGELRAYRHEGFWACMDTYKDAAVLNDLWESGSPPWRTWT